jgi:hypothetical protein
MSKATVAHVVSLGFVAEQFGTPADFSVYLQGPLDDVALRVRALVGASTYDAASSSGTDAQQLAFMRLKNAEMYLTAAELWRRIEIFERTRAVKGRGESGAETIGSRELENARQMEAQADYRKRRRYRLRGERVGAV